MSVKIEIDESKLQGKLGQLIKSSPEALEWFKDEGSRIIKQQMQMLAPVKTGFLRSSVMAVKTKRGFFVRPTALYARKIEKKYGFVAGTLGVVREQLRDLVERIVRQFYD